MSTKWRKALPLFLNAIFFVALGVFALVGTVPAAFAGVVAVVGLAVQVAFGVIWKTPDQG